MIAFYISASWAKENIYEWIKEKDISEKIMNLRDNQFRAFLAGLIFGDGHVISKEISKEEFCSVLPIKYSDKSICVYWSSDKLLIDKLAHLCVLNSFSTKCSYHKSGFKNGCYYLIISNRKNVNFRKTEENRQLQDYKGNVWCISTNNKTFVARRNGFTFITGNSHGLLPPYGLSFDVGVDCWDFYPVSLEQVKEKMATLKPIIDFRK